MKVEGYRTSMPPVTGSESPGHRPHSVKKNESRAVHRASAAPNLSKEEQRVLHHLFPRGVSNTGKYQALDQSSPRVRLGQYIDIKA